MPDDDPFVCPACGSAWEDHKDRMMGWCRECRAFTVSLLVPESAPVPVVLSVGASRIHLGTIRQGSAASMAVEVTELLNDIATRHDWVTLIEMGRKSR